jgi:hypothetical protein
LVVELLFFFIRDFCGFFAEEAKDETDTDHQGEPKPIAKDEANDNPEDYPKDNGDGDALVLGRQLQSV